MGEVVATARSWLAAAKNLWREMSAETHNVVIGCVLVGAAVLTGGWLLHSVLSGLLVNAFFWYGLWSPQMKRFMERYGRKIDILLTVGTAVMAVFVGPTMGGSLLFIAGFFSLIRRHVCPTLPADEAKEVSKKDEDIIEGEVVYG